MSVVSSGTSAEGAGVYSLKWNHYQTSMTAGLVDLLEDPEYSMTDVTLACEGQFIQAHKIVLAVSSPFFKQFFKMNRLERSGTTLIALANVEFKDLQSVIRFIYNGEVHLRNAEVRSFLETAKMLQVQGLTNESPKMGESNQGSKIKTPKSSTSAQEKNPATSVPVPSKPCPPAKRFRLASISNPPIVQDEELSVSQDHSMPIAPASRMLFTSMHNEADEEEEELISIDVKPEAVVCPTSTDFFYDEDVGEDMDNMSEPFDQSTNDYDIGFPNLIASQNSQVDFTANLPGPSAGKDSAVHGYNGECYDEVHKSFRIACLCGTTFSHKATLSRHIKEMQTRSRVSCEACGKSFDRMRNLLRHQQKSCSAATNKT